MTISYLPGTVTQLVVSPASATVAAGQGQAYTANGYTSEGADAGDLTSGSTFSISPDGSCSGATCTPASAGPHTVTATYGALIATASLDVTPPPLVYDFSGLLSPIDAAPVVNKAKAGSSVPVKFSLGADYGLDVLAEGSPSSRTVACSSGAPTDELEQTAAANKSGLTYDAGERHLHLRVEDRQEVGRHLPQPQRRAGRRLHPDGELLLQVRLVFSVHRQLSGGSPAPGAGDPPASRAARHDGDFLDVVDVPVVRWWRR